MLTAPSAAFTTATTADIRFPKVKVEALWTDPFVSSGNSVTSTDTNNFGDLDSDVVDDLNLHIVDTKLSTPHKYVINDGTTINDGTWFPVPGTVEEAAYNQVGWYTAENGDVSGHFENHPYVTVTFAEERSIKEIIVVGEPTLGEYPVDFDVYIYDITDTLLNATTNFAGSSVETLIDFTSDNILTAKYMILRLNQWSAAVTIGKIVEFFGVITDTFYSDDIVSLDVLEETDAENGTPFGCMSSNEISVEFQNISVERDGETILDPFLPENSGSYLNDSITENVRLTPYIGFALPNGSVYPSSTIEYVKMGVFWSIDWNVEESEFSAKVTARDRLNILSRNTFVADDILEDTDLAEIAEYILNHAKVNIPLNDLTWSIDASLSGYSVDYYWAGNVTYFEALRQVVSACLGKCYCDRDGVVIVESFLSDMISGSPVIEISHDDCFKKSRGMKPIKNRIVVPVSPLAPESELSDIYTSDDITVNAGDATVTQTIEWNDNPAMDYGDIVITSDGVTMFILSASYKPCGATIVFVKALAGSSGTFNFKIVGKRLLPVTGNEPVVVEDTDSISKYDRQEYRLTDNYLIQNETSAASIANAILTSLVDNKRDILVEVQGNPCLEAGDVLDIETYSKLSITDEFRVVKNQFNVNRSGMRLSIIGKKTIDFGG